VVVVKYLFDFGVRKVSGDLLQLYNYVELRDLVLLISSVRS